MQFLHLSEQRQKEIASLARKKGRVIHRQMLIEGWRSVESAFIAGASLTEVLVSENVRGDKALLSTMQIAGIPLYNLPAKVARRISTVETQPGVIAVSNIPHTPIEEFVELQTLIVLDGLQDPGNVGTIIRTAAWFGIDAVLGGTGTADFFSPKVVRASMGGIWDMKLGQTENLGADLQAMKKAGFKIASADLKGQDLNQWQPSVKTALVIGSEAHGISPEVQLVVDEAITISGGTDRKATESLNAGMAAGIIMHHWVNFRKA